MTDAGVDFFVSYASADRPWAEWIAWELEAAGYSTVLQAWDMVAGSNFVLEMDIATRAGRRTIAVLSPAFMASRYCTVEWAAAFREDPSGEQGKLVPVRVRECEPWGLLGSLVYVDIVGLSELESRDALLQAVAGGRAKPADPPKFPGRVSRLTGTGERVRRPAAGGAAIFNVPVSARTFSGRAQELMSLAAGLRGESRVAVVGMGGVGKTQLAARYARTHRSDYDVVWWVRAEHAQTLRADLAALALSLGLAEASGPAKQGMIGAIHDDEKAAITSARDWLRDNDRWLVVFDNAASPDSIASYLPGGKGGHVLITSRALVNWDSIGAQAVRADVWSREESRAFLTHRTGEPDLSVLDDIAAALGDLPLALEQAVAYTQANAITLATYVARLQGSSPSLFDQGSRHSGDQVVHASWRLAFEQLDQRPLARQILVFCAHLADRRIPRDLFDALAHHFKATLANDTDDAIALLLGLAFLAPASDQTFNMHRLIAQLTRGSLDRQEAAEAAALAVQIVDRSWPLKLSTREHWSACDRLIAHALAAVERAEQQAPTICARLLLRVGQYEQARGERGAATQLIDQVITLLERASEGAHGRRSDAPDAVDTHARELPALRVPKRRGARPTRTGFVSYAHADARLAGRFLGLMRPRCLVQRDVRLELWLDHQSILTGQLWLDEIEHALEDADFGLLCVAPSFLASTFVTDVELPALMRPDRVVIPIALEPIDFERGDLKGLGAMQVFSHRPRGTNEQRSFAECGGVNRQRFCDALVTHIVARLRNSGSI